MAWVATAELVAAVSNAGGLGVIGAGQMPPDVLREEIRRTKSSTERSFGVNMMLLHPQIDDLFQVILDEGVPVVTTGAGNPGAYVPALKAKGIKVLPVVPSVALAKRMERLEVDGLIAEGTESGGHVGELTTLVLVPQVVDAVALPVIAAGGIADGRSYAAVLALGARGVQVGTRFLCATECTVHENYKRSIIEAKDRDTVVSGRSTGHPVRALKNKLTREFDRLEKEGASAEELDKLGTGKLRLAARDGDMKWGSVMSGQCAGLVKRIQPAAEIIRELNDEAEAVIAGIRSLESSEVAPLG
ncbi:MAG: nitronate monooxygenase [Actinobacteria bacterium]|nr:nitronate monooxygenase [Actinomycetota bacterium]